MTDFSSIENLNEEQVLEFYDDVIQISDVYNVCKCSSGSTCLWDAYYQGYGVCPSGRRHQGYYHYSNSASIGNYTDGIIGCAAC